MPDELKDDPLLIGLAKRKERALRGFQQLNIGLRQGDTAYAPPPFAELDAKIDMLITQLISKGLLDLRDMLLESLHRECETLEAALQGSVEHKQQTTGLIVPTRNGHG